MSGRAHQSDHGNCDESAKLSKEVNTPRVNINNAAVLGCRKHRRNSSMSSVNGSTANGVHKLDGSVHHGLGGVLRGKLPLQKLSH